jgi:hypothetical protein
MQHKLATWAESDLNRRFDRLLRLIANREWLAEAARMVLASSGARTPGIDGMDKQRLQVKLDQHLDGLRTSLLEESYRPQPVKRIYIPKSNGVLQVHRLHGVCIPAHRSCGVLENGALAGTKVPIPHQAFDAEMVPRTGTGQGENLARVWSQ